MQANGAKRLTWKVDSSTLYSVLLLRNSLLKHSILEGRKQSQVPDSWNCKTNKGPSPRLWKQQIVLEELRQPASRLWLQNLMGGGGGWEAVMFNKLIN